MTLFLLLRNKRLATIQILLDEWIFHLGNTLVQFPLVVHGVFGCWAKWCVEVKLEK